MAFRSWLSPGVCAQARFVDSAARFGRALAHASVARQRAVRFDASGRFCYKRSCCVLRAI